MNGSLQTYSRAQALRTARYKQWVKRVLLCGLCALLMATLVVVAPQPIYADDDFVSRWDSSAMHERNVVVLTNNPSLRSSDIKLTGFNGRIINDRTLNFVESQGDFPEYVIDMTAGYASTSGMCVEAVYRDIGYNPENGRFINATISFANFTMLGKAAFDDMVKSNRWPRVPDNSAVDNPNSMIYDVPCIRLAANFEGGYWMCGVEHATIDFYFTYADTGERLDLSQAFLTVGSLDSDGMWGDNAPVEYEHTYRGQEAVGVQKQNYEQILLTEDSLVGRWGPLTPEFTPGGRVYPSDMNSDFSYFYNRVATGVGENPSDIAVTLFGVKNRTNQFHIDMIDTGGFTHNILYFGTIGTVAPPPPSKTVDDSHRYKLGDEVVFEIEQEVPGRDEQLGTYQYVRFEDNISDDLRVDAVQVFDEQKREVNTGTRSWINNEVRYEFDLANEDMYGHTYTFVVRATVIDYPEGASLEIHNKAKTYFGASNLPDGYPQETNEVTIELVEPELDTEKHIIIDNYGTVVNSYENLVGDVITYEATVLNENEGTRAKELRFWDAMEPGLAYIAGSAKIVAGADGVAQAIVRDDGENGWVFTATNIDFNKPITVRYQAKAIDAGNGREVPNAVYATAINVPKDVEGNVTNPSSNVSEAYINDPHLVLTKQLSASSIQNDDYIAGEEFRVGDSFIYTVTLENTAPGTIAKNVVLTDDVMPAGLTCTPGSIQVKGLGVQSNPKTIMYPMHKDDDIPGEVESRTIDWNIRDVKHASGVWGWELVINYVASAMPVAISWEVTAEEEVNGWEIENEAVAWAENSLRPVHSNKTLLWVNSPILNLEKHAAKTDRAYQVGDVASYDVVMRGLKVPGTLARHTVLEDAFETEGTTIVENSFVITDVDQHAQDIRSQVDLHRGVGDQFWSIDMKQVYNDTTGYWVADDEHRFVWQSDGTLSKREGSRNPVGVNEHRFMKVHYEATINDMALQNELVNNIARADADETDPVEASEAITVVGAVLDINKTSNDGGHFQAGDVADYEITVVNNNAATIAQNVQISDRINTARAGAVAIVEDSVELFDAENAPIEGWKITWTSNEAGNHTGFDIDTGYNLASSGKITVRYKVKYLTNNGSSVLRNTASTWASNAPQANDEYETWPDDADRSMLRIDKGSDKQVYTSGDIGLYTLRIVNTSPDQTAFNVVIDDRITEDSLSIARLVKGSVSIANQEGKAVLGNITYVQSATGQYRGFSVETGYDLAPGEALNVTYHVAFDGAYQQAGLGVEGASTGVTQATNVHNAAWTAADNTPKANDEHVVQVVPQDETPNPDDPNQPGDPDGPQDPDDPKDPGDPSDNIYPQEVTDPPTLIKRATREVVAPGETVGYFITVQAGGHEVRQAQVTDTPDPGITIDPSTIRVTLNGEIVPANYTLQYGSDMQAFSTSESEGERADQPADGDVGLQESEDNKPDRDEGASAEDHSRVEEEPHVDVVTNANKKNQAEVSEKDERAADMILDLVDLERFTAQPLPDGLDLEQVPDDDGDKADADANVNADVNDPTDNDANQHEPSDENNIQQDLPNDDSIHALEQEKGRFSSILFKLGDLHPSDVVEISYMGIASQELSADTALVNTAVLSSPDYPDLSSSTRVRVVTPEEYDQYLNQTGQYGGSGVKGGMLAKTGDVIVHYVVPLLLVALVAGAVSICVYRRIRAGKRLSRSYAVALLGEYGQTQPNRKHIKRRRLRR